MFHTEQYTFQECTDRVTVSGGCYRVRPETTKLVCLFFTILQRHCTLGNEKGS